MKATSRQHQLTQGIEALARAVGTARRRPAGRAAALGPRASFVLPEPPAALATDELLVVVADARSVALQRLSVPAAGPVAAGGSRPSKLAEIARRIAEIEVIAVEIAQTRPAVAAPLAPLPEPEERLLRASGLDPRPLAPDEAYLLHRTTAEYAKLLSESYTVEEAARLLGVNASRIRQRLTGAPRTLYGIKSGKSWRIPRFQFPGRRLVPGIERTLGRLAADVHPVAVYRWFTSPNPDLVFGDKTPTSPLDWLRAGNPPDVVAELAASL